MPRIRSESPAFDLHHFDLTSLDQKENTGQRDVIDAAGHEGERS
jgi:cytochrome c oxidase subunit 1